MREHVKADEPFTPRGRDHRRRARALPGRGPAVQGRAGRGPDRERRRRDGLALSQRSVHSTSAAARTCPAPAASARSSSSASPARTGAATRTRQMLTRVYGTAFFDAGGARRAPEAPRGGARPRPPQARPRARPVHVPRGQRPGSPFWLPAGHGGVERARRASGARRTPRAATGRSRRRSCTTSTCSRPAGTGTCTATTCTSRRSRTRLMGLKPMNCPAHILIYDAERRSYRELPVRLAELGPRAPPRAERHAARPRSASGTSRRTTRTSSARPSRSQDEIIGCLRLRFAIYDAVRPATSQARAVDAAREAHRHRRRSGTRRRPRSRGRSTRAGSRTRSTRATAPSTARRSTCT